MWAALTQTHPLMYTGKAHPHPWTYADTLASHTCHDNHGCYSPWPTFRYAYLTIEKESFHLDDDACSLEAWQYTRNTIFLVLYDLFLGRLYKPWKIPRGCTEIFWFLMPCNSGTARWKNFVPVLYYRATQELLNGAWIMGIHPGEPKSPTFARGAFYERLRVLSTEALAAELMNVSGW